MPHNRRPIRIDYRDREMLHPTGKLIDLDTGIEIKSCYRFDERTGDWARYVRIDGRLQLNAYGPLTEEGHGNIWFEPYGLGGAEMVRVIEDKQYGDADATQEKA